VGDLQWSREHAALPNEEKCVLCCLKNVQRWEQSAQLWMGEHNKEGANLTCHETVHMEEGHDHKGLVLWGQLVGGHDVGQAGRQVALIQWHTLQAIVAM